MRHSIIHNVAGSTHNRLKNKIFLPFKEGLKEICSEMKDVDMGLGADVSIWQISKVVEATRLMKFFFKFLDTA